MDLSNLKLDELRQRLDAIDKNAAPHEALELSNEIGRRTADHAGEPDEASIQRTAVNAVRRSPWFALLGIFIFGITSHLHPPDDTFVLATVIAGIVSGLGLIRMWETGNDVATCNRRRVDNTRTHLIFRLIFYAMKMA